ncbi:hypothetical protein NADFUDRAFT_65676 [Nadsonia fulvescens var. elongata DSM 6958]|uniref:Rad9-domain-containing protein n=1 Tax=Nadsonia fulvescens var. elongata DSM 6958 TaxID=857566 RepID=A0A1E3PLX1_9ASCO|nr:hypothetical protein NADFUDRAFT_65676 [Nadsonia fulvescens var. elongata DSM 6958]
MFHLEANFEGSLNMRRWVRSMVCLARIGEYINFETSNTQISLWTHNQAKTNIGCVTFHKDKFFKTLKLVHSDANSTGNGYDGINKGYDGFRSEHISSVRPRPPRSTQGHDSNSNIDNNISYAFRIQATHLLSVFKRMENDKSILKCDLALSANENQRNQRHPRINSPKFEIMTHCQHGIEKLHYLLFEETAVFSIGNLGSMGPDYFNIPARIFRDYLEDMPLKATKLRYEFEEENGSIKIESYSDPVKKYDKDSGNRNSILNMPFRTKLVVPINKHMVINARNKSNFTVSHKDFRNFVTFVDSLSDSDSSFSSASINNQPFDQIVPPSDSNSGFECYYDGPGTVILCKLDSSKTQDSMTVVFKFLNDSLGYIPESNVRVQPKQGLSSLTSSGIQRNSNTETSVPGSENVTQGSNHFNSAHESNNDREQGVNQNGNSGDIRYEDVTLGPEKNSNVHSDGTNWKRRKVDSSESNTIGWSAVENNLARTFPSNQTAESQECGNHNSSRGMPIFGDPLTPDEDEPEVKSRVIPYVPPEERDVDYYDMLNDEDEDIDVQFTQFALELERGAVGPTQESRPKGLFD